MSPGVTRKLPSWWGHSGPRGRQPHLLCGCFIVDRRYKDPHECAVTRAPALAGRRNHQRGRWVRSPAPPTPVLMRPRQRETPTPAHTPAHTCTCADTQDTCMHTPVYTRAHTCMDTILHTILHAYKCIHVHIPAGTQAFMYTHPPVYTCMPLYLMHTHALCIYMHTLASTHVYTPTQDKGPGMV